MNDLTQEDLQKLLPLACAWAEEQEREIASAGVLLTREQLDDARRVGVERPERVRLLAVPVIPRPRNAALAAAATATGLLSPSTAGLTLRYGIYVREDWWGQRPLLVHELTHTMQYERLGGIEPFLRQYLYEVLTSGYAEAPLEEEARRIEREVCLKRHQPRSSRRTINEFLRAEESGEPMVE